MLRPPRWIVDEAAGMTYVRISRMVLGSLYLLNSSTYSLVFCATLYERRTGLANQAGCVEVL